MFQICNRAECSARLSRCCERQLRCGHACGGYRGERESECPPCLQLSCVDVARAQGVDQHAEHDCTICGAEGARFPICPIVPLFFLSLRTMTDFLCGTGLGQAPVVVLACSPHVRHMFHLECVRLTLTRRWAGAAIDFGFLNCPLCVQPIRHPAFADLLRGFAQLHRKVCRYVSVYLNVCNLHVSACVRAVLHVCLCLNDFFDYCQKKLMLSVQVVLKAMERLRFDRLDRDASITQRGGRYFCDPAAFALQHYAFFQCFQCQVWTSQRVRTRVFSVYFRVSDISLKNATNQDPYYGGARICAVNNAGDEAGQV